MLKLFSFQCVWCVWSAISEWKRFGFLTQKNAERVQEEIKGREQDKEQFEIDIRTQDEIYKEQIGRMDKKMTEAREVWERDRQEYERRQREIMAKLEEERNKRRGG